MWTESYLNSISTQRDDNLSEQARKDYSEFVSAKLRGIETNYESLSDRDKEKYEKWLKDQYGVSYSSLSTLRYY